MKSYYYFHGDSAVKKAEAFAAERSEFHPKIFEQNNYGAYRVVVVLER